MKDLAYKSTRTNNERVSAGMAILKGICEDGGLYVPENIPVLDKKMNELINLNYQDLAYEILKLYLTDFTDKELKDCINNAYDDKFDTTEIAPLKAVSGEYFLELFHGKTIAFKDMALSILPYLLKTAANKNGMNKKIIILTATSGDTGKAALEGFKDVDGTGIIVFYPKAGVSDIQEAQMLTTEGDNTFVVGVNGNFDDCQTKVKKLFLDKKMNIELNEKGFVFSSANSINIGRLVPQIVYYFYAYGQMVKNNHIKCGETINFAVPTGNFGNILAAFYAKQMGLPIHKLICASNDNKVLFDFFRSGCYDAKREFILTISPSMDILISSNLERLLYFYEHDGQKISELMSELEKNKSYGFNVKSQDIISYFATETETMQAIKKVYEKGYVMDTHTAVAYISHEKYVQETGDTTKTVIVSTASPYKFTGSVCNAIDNKYKDYNEFDLINELSVLSKTEIPKPVYNLHKMEYRHNIVCEKEEMGEVVISCLEKL